MSATPVSANAARIIAPTSNDTLTHTLKSGDPHAVMRCMRKKRLHSRDMNNAFAAAAEALALFCRLRNVDAADLPAQDVDILLDLAFEEAAQQAAARSEARRPG
ncbi:hypothetical protein [Caballeronia sp. TF1N1]|uniref:hypothetical protein n=1 Tax=Caballeronia sp. TF1N1 TaxID=2878153 RepID=UPI001FD043C4|nr:hypothetical protein [Caballeronia sp. TF1N1]